MSDKQKDTDTASKSLNQVRSKSVVGEGSGAIRYKESMGRGRLQGKMNVMTKQEAEETP